MRADTTTFFVLCDGPPLDYTARVNLDRADIVVLDDFEPGPRRRFTLTPVGLRLLVEASDEREALDRARDALEQRPYVDFRLEHHERRMASRKLGIRPR